MYLFLLFQISLLHFVFFFSLKENETLMFVYCSCWCSSSKLKTSNFIGLPNHVSQGSGSQLTWQNCYVEVTLGCPRPRSDRALQSNSNSFRNVVKHHPVESPSLGRGDQKGSLDNISVYEKTFVYPAEAVLVPSLQVAGSSLKRYLSFSVPSVRLIS